MGYNKNSITKILMLIITALVLVVVSSVNNVYAYLMKTETVTNEFSINPGAPHQITGEVIGGNATISGLPETVYDGNNMQNDVYITPTAGYRIATARVYTGDEIDGDYDDTDGTDIKANFYRKGRDGKIKLIGKFTNVTGDMHIVVTMEVAQIVAQIVDVPGGAEGNLANLTSGTGAGTYTILNHQYTTLEDAIYDAQLVNDANTNNLTGTVIIKILADIDDEINDIETNNYVTIDLNGHTIKIDNDTNKVITVKNGAKLTLINNGSEINPATNQDSEIVNLDGISIYVENGGELTLGVDDRRVSVSTPTIEGENFGIYREAGSILNFYDGKVIGDTDSAIAGNLQNINTPQLHEVVNSAQGTKEISFVSIPAGIEAMIGNTKYTLLEDAFEAVENNASNTRNGTPTEIDVVAEVTIEDAITLSQNKNVILDLNGHTITGTQTNAVLNNNGKLEIKDSTGIVNQDYPYAQLVNNGTYYFTKVGDHLESNNYGVASSTANSYIEIDLSNESSTDTFTLNVNANISSEGNDIGYLTVNTSTTAPSYIDGVGRFAYIAGINKPTDYVTTLTGGQTYYLHLGYTKNANTDYYFDTFMINDITLNGESLISELEQGRGKISNANYGVINNSADGDLKISSGKIEGTYPYGVDPWAESEQSGNVYSTVLNSGDMTVTGGKIYASANLAIGNVSSSESTVGKELNLNGGLIYSNNAFLGLINGTNRDMEITNNTRVFSYLFNGGNLNVTGGKFTHLGGNNTPNIQSKGTFSATGGEFATTYYGIYINGTDNGYIRNVTIKSANGILLNSQNGCNIQEEISDVNISLQGGNGIYLIDTSNGYMNVELDGVTINGTGTGIIEGGGEIYNSVIPNNTLEISNTNINVNGNAIRISDITYSGGNGNVNVLINSGTFTSTENHTFYIGYPNFRASRTFTVKDAIVISPRNYSIYNWSSGIINLNGGIYIANNNGYDYEQNKYTIYNTGDATINIGNKNTAENMQTSKTSPTLISNYTGIYNLNGTLNFYDGQIIAPTGNVINGSLNEIEETDGNGNHLGLFITSNAENETEQELRMDISDIIKPNKTYERMFLDIQGAVAKILKTATGLDFTQIESTDYYSDDTYYYFYKLSDAVKVCDTSAGNNVTTIDVILDFMITDEFAEVTAGQNVEINLNGHTIQTLTSNTAITNNGILELTDTIGTGKIIVNKTAFENNDTAIININILSKSNYNSSDANGQSNHKVITNTGTLQMDGGTITGYYATVIDNTGTFTLNDGTITGLTGTASGYIANAFSSWGIANRVNGRCVVNGGTINCAPPISISLINSSVGIYNGDNATLKIDGGSISINTGVGYLIYNTSSSVYEAGVSEPSLYIASGIIQNGYVEYGTVENEVWIKKAQNKTLTISGITNFKVKGKLVIEDATISGSVQNDGTSANSSTTITNSTINGNLASSAVVNDLDDTTITGTVTLSGTNSADQFTNCQTGAITKSGAGSVLVDDSTIVAFYNNGAATATITDTTVNNTGAYLVSNASTGSITINNSTINGTVQNSGTGTISIPSVGTTTITADGYWGSSGWVSLIGIRNTSTGTITIGTKSDGTVSTQYPYIQSNGNYAISNENSDGHICFYDGIAKAQTGKTLYGSLYETESGYSFTVHDESATNQYAILERLAVAKILKTDVNVNNLVAGTYVELDADYYGFNSLQAAFNVCTNNQETEIILLGDIAYTASESTQTVPVNKDIVLDMSGYTISFGYTTGITVPANAKLKITDSSAAVGSLIGNNGVIANNAGTLIIENINVNETLAGTTSSYVNAFVNTGNITLRDITYICANYVTILENSGTSNVIRGANSYSSMSAASIRKFVNNTGAGDVIIDSTVIDRMNIYNYDTGTIKLIDIDLTGQINNYSSSVYQAGVSEPAIHVIGGTLKIRISNNETYDLFNYDGEIVFENNTAHANDNDNLLSVITTASNTFGTIRNSDGKITCKSGYYNCDIVNNAGTAEITGGTYTRILTNSAGNSSICTIDGGIIQGDILNGENATMNIYSGYLTNSTHTKSITNAGTMNIGQNDGTVISYTDIPLDGGNNPITNIGAPIIEGSINTTGTVNFYDGIIIANNSREICNNVINEIPANTEIIHTNYSTYHTYSLSSNTVVATIGNTDYYTLESAFDACKNTTGNKTIVMQASIALANKASIESDNSKLGYFEITANSDVTLDLNGKSIDGLCSKLLFVNNGTFEIADTNATPNGKINTYSNGLIYNTNDLEISGGAFTVKGANSRTIIENVGTGTVNITGGALNPVSLGSSINGYGILSTSTGNVTVSGGTFTSNRTSGSAPCYGIYINNTDTNIKPTLAISNNATFNQYNPSTNENALYVKNVILNISGGTNNCLKYSSTYPNVAEDSTVTVSGGTTAGGIALTNSTLTVTGGTIGGITAIDATSSLTMSGATASIGEVSNNGAATVTAGTITGMFTNENGKTATMSGATFTTSGGVANSGTITVANSNITTSATVFENGGSGVLTVTNTTATTTGDGLVMSGGTVTLEDVTIQASGDYGAYITGGTLNIPYETTGGTTNNTEITATAGIGLRINGGTVNLGDLAYPVYNTTPEITGKTYGVKVDGGTFNFYDGILHSTDNDAFYGTIGAIPELYSVYFTDSTKTTAYLAIQATTENVVKVGNTNYPTVASAVNAINNSGKVGTIEFLKDIVITSPISIPAGNDITFDMQGYTLKYSGTDAAIVNNSTLTIIDTLAATSTTIGYIDNFQGPAIENKGTLTIGENDGSLQTRAPKVIGATYGIVSTQSGTTLNFYDGTIEGQTAPVNGTITTDISLYTLTTGTEVRTYGSNNITYNTAYLQ